MAISLVWHIVFIQPRTYEVEIDNHDDTSDAAVDLF